MTVTADALCRDPTRSVRPAELQAALERVADAYPAVPSRVPDVMLPEQMKRTIPRIAFCLRAVADRVGVGARVADVGGGLSLFAPGAATLGFESILVDDFREGWFSETYPDVTKAFESLGVRILSEDVLSPDFGFPSDSLDAVTLFDVIEHLHKSPRPLLHKLMDALKPGGLMFIGVPNCVNLRKRLTVPFGVGQWSPIESWYDEPVFRGHVREPDVADLRYIARDLNLKDPQIVGRNWLGYGSRFQWVRILLPLADKILQVAPGLCSNIYLMGRKPVNPARYNV